MHKKPAITSVKLHEIIEHRWSPRAYDAHKGVSTDDLTALLEAARWTPSCFNDQPWRFIVCNKATHENEWQILLNCLAEKNQQWAKNAPVFILAVAMANFNHSGKANRWAQYDTGAACLSLSLQATALGLIAHSMGGFDEQQIRDSFNLPLDATPMSVIAIGFQGEVELLHDDFKEIELAQRSRAPLEQRFYFGSWQV